MRGDNSLTFPADYAIQLLRRGQYMSYIQGMYSESPAWSRCYVRIVGIAGCTVTTRPIARARLVEWTRARWEDWFAWPLADFKARFRGVRP